MTTRSAGTNTHRHTDNRELTQQDGRDGKPSVTSVTIVLLKLLSAKLHLSLNRSFCERPENINDK